MRTLNNIFTLLLFSAFLFSCDDIFEEDIENDTLEIISPLQNNIIESNVTNFRWQELEGATKYRVKIYDNNDDEIADTLVPGKTNLVYPLNQGHYKWKARAENAAYESKYSDLIDFSVVENLDLTNQIVLLTRPEDNKYTNSTSLNCIWQDLTAADNYDFELINITSGQTIVQQTGINSTSFTVNNSDIASEAKYLWRVKAKNTTSETVFSARAFFIDRTIPNTPTLSAPNNNALINSGQNTTFNWTTGTDNGVIQSSISYTYEVSNSPSFNSLIFSSTITADSIQKSFTTSGDHYWRVKATDRAGNTSILSQVFKFTIN